MSSFLHAFNAERGYKVFYLSPNVEIVLHKDEIILNHTPWKSYKPENSENLEPWPYCDENSFQTISREKLHIKFDIEDHAKQWYGWLNAEKKKRHFSDDVVRDANSVEFEINLSYYLWKMILYGNASIQSFYFNIANEVRGK